MPDAASVVTILGTINQAIGLGRILRDSEKAFDKAELRIKMSELIDRLVDAKEQLQTNREENIELRSEILNLKEQIGKRNDIVFEKNKYYLKKSDGAKDGPYCQKCFDKDEKLIRLQKEEVPGYPSHWHCTTCNMTYDYPKINYSNRNSGNNSSGWV